MIPAAGGGAAGRGHRDPDRLPRLHVVTDDAVLAEGAFERRARAVLERGGPGVALHVRGPGTSGRRLHDLVTALIPVARCSGALLLVNDRVDVAMAGDADGVQLGERSLPVDEARRLLHPDRWVGASVHAPDGAERAAAADFLVVGTIFRTQSHPGRSGAGPALLSGVRERVAVPLVAIGGVRPDRVRHVVSAGARGVAVLRGVWGSEDPAGAVASYQAALAEADGADDPGRAGQEER